MSEIIERDAFGTAEAVNSRADLTDLLPDNKQDYSEATFENNGVDLSNDKFQPEYDEVEEELDCLTCEDCLTESLALV